MAKKRGEARVLITLACPDCRERNYNTQKNRRNDANRMEFRKFCPRCRQVTLHRELR